MFGEGGARIIVSVGTEDQIIWESYLTQQLGNNWQKIGQVSSNNASLRVFMADNQPLIEVTIESVSDRFFNAIERRLTTDSQSANLI